MALDERKKVESAPTSGLFLTVLFWQPNVSTWKQPFLRKSCSNSPPLILSLVADHVKRKHVIP